MTSQPARDIWEAALGELQLQVTRPNYETWLKDTVGLTVEDGRFTVGTPTAFAAEWLSKRMAPIVEKTLAGILKHPVHVSFQVHRPTDAEGRPKALSPHDTAPEDAPAPDSPNGARANRLNPRYTFETFVVGDSNRVAHAAALSVAEKPGESYNPLFIYSGVGLGKTHLLHAIAQEVLQRHLKLLYVSSEKFVNDYVTSIRERSTEEFRTKYRAVDVLLVDDVQFFIGKEQTQEVFFHTFNDLYEANSQIIITSDRHPKALTLLEDRLTSRLVWGLTTEIYPPDYETRLAILKAKAEQTKSNVPQDILEMLARRFQRNIRELEGALNRVVAYARLTRSPLTLDTTTQALADLPAERGRPPSAEAIIQSVSSYFGLEPGALPGRRRDKHTALARQIAMYLLKEDASRSLVEIGHLLGGRDHTTVMYGCDKIEAQVNTDARLRSDILEIRASLTQQKLQASS
ncbi:MAG: chromosomal replication initiator protein DnaA [Chloroflexi bacterium]|nr:chromosomal replication initiator protein DnaA [Chloroflexota bacterium]